MVHVFGYRSLGGRRDCTAELFVTYMQFSRGVQNRERKHTAVISVGAISQCHYVGTETFNVQVAGSLLST